MLCAALAPGMVLSHDRLSREGLLLPAERVLNAQLIEQLREFEHQSRARLDIRIHPPPAP